tara:strand:- start:529 stop:717 length:189 start_codon:yes stop_codon:yes gene_type:complete
VVWAIATVPVMEGRAAAPGPAHAKMIIARGLVTLIFCLGGVAVKLARDCLQQPPALRFVGVK